MDPSPRHPPERRSTAALSIAAVVGSVSVFVVLLLSADVRSGDGLTRYDWRVLRDFRRHRSALLVDGAHALAKLGSIETLLVAAVVVGLVLLWRQVHPILCAVPLASLLVAGGFVEVIKITIARAGPHAQFQFGSHGTGSFPSGHSADTTAFCVGLAIVLVAALLRRPAERAAVFGAAALVSVAVGVSRLVLGVHWPTDVLAGWALGLGTAVAIGTVAVLATQDHRLAAAFGPPSGDARPVARPVGSDR